MFLPHYPKSSKNINENASVSADKLKRAAESDSFKIYLKVGLRAAFV
ncbi:MAG: hypothetical protein HYT12_03830 [Candidatus Liptonbacteria bacterium]|nr:hypothetical protein [Candidatus Liptonbacteria bacterium]